MIIYLASLGVVASLFLMKWALSSDGRKSSPAVRRSLGLAATESSQDFRPAPVNTSRFGARSANRLSGEKLQRRIAVAGLRWKSANVQVFRLASFAVGVLLGGLFAVATQSLLFLVLGVATGAVIAAAPNYVIALKGEERQKLIEEELPDILDRLKITLEAGLGFDSALAKVVNGRTGPAYDEFKRVGQDLQLGVPRDEALQAMSDRTTIIDLRIVLAAILQSSKYGLPLVEVLRIQTEELRDKRWQRAQEAALKIPVKILFPLILCIMPTFFVILVVPSFIQIGRTL